MHDPEKKVIDDALVSKCCYKDSFSYDRVLEMIAAALFVREEKDESNKME